MHQQLLGLGELCKQAYIVDSTQTASMRQRKTESLPISATGAILGSVQHSTSEGGRLATFSSFPPNLVSGDSALGAGLYLYDMIDPGKDRSCHRFVFGF